MPFNLVNSYKKFIYEGDSIYAFKPVMFHAFCRHLSHLLCHETSHKASLKKAIKMMAKHDNIPIQTFMERSSSIAASIIWSGK